MAQPSVAAATAFLAFQKLIDGKMSSSVHPSRCLDAINTLCRICENLIQFPSDPKYKSLKMAGNTFKQKLLPVDGAVEFLQLIGFSRRVVDHEEVLVLASVDESLICAAVEALTRGKGKTEYRLKNLRGDKGAESEEKVYSETLRNQVRLEREERYAAQSLKDK